MTVLTRPQALTSDDAIGLRSIRDDDCNLVIWQRNALPDMARVLNGRPQNVRFSESLDRFEGRLVAELDAHGFGCSAMRRVLVADICDLARRYGAIFSLGEVELRLEIVTTDSCHRFHADYVDARLITTYAGAGTQWIDTAEAVRVADGSEPVTIHSLKAGDVGIFKGTLATEHPAIHRSPPIGNAGGRRLLLVLNRVEKP